MDYTSLELVDFINYAAMFIAAISGASAGIRRNADAFGVGVLAIATACSGGLIRDILMGDLPPDNIKSWHPLAASLAGGCFAFFFYTHLRWFLKHPVQITDAFGLGLFTVLGADKAVTFGITPIWAVLMGVITGIGGGMARDILLATTPSILRAEIYATASLAGGTIVVLCRNLSLVDRDWAMLLGALVCVVIRCLAIKYKWNIPIKAESGRFDAADRRER